MGGVVLKNTMSSILSPLSGKKPKLADITFIGCGGVFDIEEKNSSAIIQPRYGLGFLIDCGSTTFPWVISNKQSMLFDIIFITHTHDDHIGSLSALINYNKHFKKRQTKIVTSKDVGELLRKYLIEICNHSPDDFKMIHDPEDASKLGVAKLVSIIDTSGSHKDGFASCGFLFSFDSGLKILYSGDVCRPIFELLDESQMDMINEDPDFSIIFHDATINQNNTSHCFFENLESYSGEFKNIYTYHHSAQEGEKIVFNSRRLKSVPSYKGQNTFIAEGS